MAELDDENGDFEPLAVGKMVVAPDLTDKQIENQFEGGRLRVVQEKNDIFLSHVMTFIRGNGGLWEICDRSIRDACGGTGKRSPSSSRISS